MAMLAVAALVLTSCSSSDDAGEQAAPTTTGDTAAGITADSVQASLGPLDAVVDEVMTATGVPGVAVAVVHNDAAVYEKGFGVREVGTDQPVTAETVFQIASLSKPVSSTVMAGMVGDGVFEWDDPLIDYAPDLELTDQWVAEHVTFADLFSHRSGIPGGPAGNDLEAVGFERDTILERMRYVPLDEFRLAYSYSNFGLTLAGEVAAQAAGTTWDQAAQQVLFEPAGMTSTSASHADFISRDNRAALHVPAAPAESGDPVEPAAPAAPAAPAESGDPVVNEWVAGFGRQPDAQAPAGGVSSNVVDLARWMRLSLAGGLLDGNAIIATEALDATHTPQSMRRPPAPTIGDPADFYGLGWGISTDATGTIRWSHSGAFSTGAATVAVLVPSENLGIVVLTNAAPIGAAEAIADAYVGYLQTGDTDVPGALATWGDRFADLYGEPEVDVDDPPANPLPARADAAYVGSYANDYVGTVDVRVGGDGLELVIGPQDRVYELTHWDGDTFVWFDAPELPMFPATAVFDVTDGNQAATLTLSSLDGAGLGTLTRT